MTGEHANMKVRTNYREIHKRKLTKIGEAKTWLNRQFNMFETVVKSKWVQTTKYVLEMKKSVIFNKVRHLFIHSSISTENCV